MSTYALLGIIFLLGSISLFGYQILTAILEMGVSDEFKFENIRLTDILANSTLEWIDGFSNIYFQSIAETLLTMPFAILLFAAAILLFLMHTFTNKKRIRKS
jgi:hypothetical protein